MDQAILVIFRIGDGQRLIEHLVARHFPVSAAFWLYTNDNEKWSLCIVSPDVEREGVENPYGVVLQAFRDVPDLQIDQDDFTLISPRRPLARGVLNYLKQYPSSKAKRVEKTLLGDVYVESAYIYPPSLHRPDESAAGRA
jgi:hypothetical protein